MLRSMTMSALAVGAMICLGAATASAAPPMPAGQSLSADTTVEKVQMGRCRAWFRECRARWGWGWRFRRCMARHAC